MMSITTKDGRRLTHTDAAISTFAVCVPHQRQAYLAYPPFEPDEEAGDNAVLGDHDLHTLDLIETIEDAAIVIEQRGCLHQSGRRAALIEDELISQGVLKEEEAE